jgi:hypothetical protein
LGNTLAESTGVAQRPLRKDHMVPKQPPKSSAAARRRLAEEMLRLGQRIDRQQSGPERLAMLRQQANLSDQLEVLRAERP